MYSLCVAAKKRTAKIAFPSYFMPLHHLPCLCVCVCAPSFSHYRDINHACRIRAQILSFAPLFAAMRAGDRLPGCLRVVAIFFICLTFFLQQTTTPNNDNNTTEAKIPQPPTSTHMNVYIYPYLHAYAYSI